MASDWEGQLLRLRALTASAGAVHDAQLLQLRQWGAVAFGAGKGRWEAQVDVEDKTVTYTMPKRLRPAIEPQYVALLDKSIHWLLGPTWGLRLVEAGAVIYEGARESAAKKRNESRKSRTTS